MRAVAQALRRRGQGAGQFRPLAGQRQAGEVLQATHPRGAHLEAVEGHQRLAQARRRVGQPAGQKIQLAERPARVGLTAPVAGAGTDRQRALDVPLGLGHLPALHLKLAEREFGLALALGVLDLARDGQRRQQMRAPELGPHELHLDFTQLQQRDGLADAVAAVAEQRHRLGRCSQRARQVAAAELGD